MDELQVTGVERYAAIRVAPRKTIFRVAFDGATDGGELAPDLVVSSCLQVDLQQVVVVRVGNASEREDGFLGPFRAFLAGEGLVQTFVAGEVVDQGHLVLRRQIFDDGPILLFQVAVVPEHVV